RRRCRDRSGESRTPVSLARQRSWRRQREQRSRRQREQRSRRQRHLQRETEKRRSFSVLISFPCLRCSVSPVEYPFPPSPPLPFPPWPPLPFPPWPPLPFPPWPPLPFPP